ncbi:hypothetical protein CHLRE_02g143550v5 [Chlamydomonas reinhardtii]|uniref:Uncharacterized protein n=1 Tax=Chlamydomonas reinhardtii TaxID=3055 RepID=A8J0S5_CHLRE|nr:uncharacterized protein CHLRE_02g143550v5 [Chlamydomonas reinhardtii]PNW87506.1 hypothetical protein CHLRE_02g143550v5 [Chlamydomonas reinhardtii]|eukprot:XP_001694984.1 early light-inducible protein [Chlamydomonas reinhardtii]
MLAKFALKSSAPLRAATSRSVRPVRAVLVAPNASGNGTATLVSQAPAQALSAAPADYVDARTWQMVNLTKATLLELTGIPLQKTVENYNLTISYEPAADELVVIDYAKGVRFPAVFGPDNKVRVDIQQPVPTAVIGLSFEALSNVLRADSAAAELINGRAAMLGVFLGLFGEVTRDEIVVRQLFTTDGAYNAMLVGALVLAASVAPAILGRVPVQNVFPDEHNPPSTAGDLPNVWNYNAERLNGRVAMVGFLGLMVSEMLSERQCGVVTKLLSNWSNWSC